MPKINLSPVSLKSVVVLLNRLVVIAAILGMVSSMALSTVGATYAQDGKPPSGGATKISSATSTMQTVIFDIVKLFIQFTIMVSLGIFGFSVSRGLLSAQIAQAVGSASGVSNAWMSIISGLFIFLAALMSPLIVGMIADAVKVYVFGADGVYANPLPAWKP